MRNIAKKLLAALLVFALVASVLPGQRASAATSLPDELYLAQEGSRTCTLASITMVLRSRMYLSGSSGWSSITESKVRSVAWSSAGLAWNFTYTTNGNTMKVGHETVSGISVSALKSVLDAHPEGILLYCKSKPHGVFLTDYEGDTFYCADPAGSYSGKRLTLSDSLLGDYYGGQAKVLKAVSAYWYISSYSITPDTFAVHYDPNGGDGEMDSQNISYDHTLTLSPNAFAWEGHNFTGWQVERSDGMWLVDGRGWMSESDIAAGGYTPKLYPDGWSGLFDSSWTGGNGNLSYTFHAQWEEVPCWSGHSYQSEVTLPTCTAGGYTTYTCAGCGDSYEADPTDPIDHELEGGTCVHCAAVIYLPGDINGDGEINNKDATRLFQYLSGWEVEVTESALDINGDGEVNNKDATRLFQHLSGWDVEIC